MEIKDIQNAGSDILDAVTKAVSTGNYSNLSSSIRRSVDSITAVKPGVLSDAMKEALNASGRPQTPAVRPGAGQAAGATQAAKTGTAAGQAQGTISPSASAPYQFNEHLKGKSAQWVRPDTLRTSSQSYGTRNNARVKDASPETPYFRQGFRKAGASTGTLSLILGVLMALGGGALTLVMLIITLLSSGLRAGTLIGCILFGALTGAGVYFARKGYLANRLYGRYRLYGRTIGDAEYISVDDLASYTGIDRETVIKDIRACIKAGYLNETWIDDNETTIMVSRRVYDQYMSAEKSRRERELKELALQNNLSGSIYEEQVRQILKDGDDYLKTVKRLNDEIPDPDMSRKISRIEDLMHKTFEEVKTKPESAPSLRKYMSYYLPTTIKLLTAYAELDDKPEIGENIAQTKKEISDSLDMVGDGFEKLFDSLFEEMSWDIASDISVMKTMMAQDGLAEQTISNFKAQNAAEKRLEEVQ